MDLAPWLPLLRLVHVLAAFGFVLVHGASAMVAFKLRGERDRTRIQALMELSNAYLNWLYVALLVLLLAGILSGIAGGYWTSGRYWLWASLGLLIAIVVAMHVIATPTSTRFATLSACRHSTTCGTSRSRRIRRTMRIWRDSSDHPGLCRPQPSGSAGSRSSSP